MLAHRDFLAWSPDGQTLVLVNGGLRECWDEKAIGIASSSQIPTPLSPSGRADLFLAFSPDGRTIAFTSGPEVHVGGGDRARQALQERRIWVMDAADGRRVFSVAHGPSPSPSSPTRITAAASRVEVNAT